MEQIDYASLLPKTPSVDLVQWALEQDVFQKEYLIYKASRVYEPLEDRMRPAVEVVCTNCGKKFFAEKVDAGGCSAAYAPAPFGWYHHEMSESVISGSITMCPACGCEVKVVHVGGIPRGIEDCAWITTMSRLPIEGRRDRFVLTDWMVKRQIAKSGGSQYPIMLKEFIEHIQKTTQPIIQQIGDSLFSINGAGDVREIRPTIDHPDTLPLQSLDALVKLVRTEAAQVEAPLYITIPDHLTVRCFDRPQPEARFFRQVYYEAHATDVPGWGEKIDGPQTGFAGAGNTYVTINSPVAVDAVTAAREWKKTTQRMAMDYI